MIRSIITILLLSLASCTGGNGGEEAAKADAALLQCDIGVADCNGDSLDGCETDLATDRSNCGACGEVCNENQLCTVDGCADDNTLLVSDLAAPVALAVDATHVYWLNAGLPDELQNPGIGTLMRLAKDGGVPEILAEGIIGARSLIVDDTHAFWGAEGLWKTLKDGSGDAQEILAGGHPGVLRQNETHVFFEQLGDFSLSGRSLMSVAKDGANPNIFGVLSEFGSGLEVAEGFVYYYAMPNAIHRRPADGSGSEEVFVSGLGPEIGQLVLYQGTAFWTTNDIDDVRVRKSSGSSILNIAIEDGFNPVGLVLDEQDAYFALSRDTNVTGTAIIKTAQEPGESTAIVEVPAGRIRGLVGDDSNLYWLTTEGDLDAAKGALHRVSK